MATNSLTPKYVNTSPYYGAQLRKFAGVALVTLFATLLVTIYLLPFGNMALLSLRDQDMLSQTADTPIFPMKPETIEWQGKTYDVYEVPTESGTRQLALVKKGRASSEFVDPANPDAGTITWEGSWRSLQPAWVMAPRWENFPEAWNLLNFPLLFRNTLAIAVFGMIGTLISCISVAYAFARFPLPGKNIMFLILISTIILPTQVTLIPTFVVFAKIGWVNTWLPLIIPHFFANAYNVFLLRQFFMTLPRELDEAAMIDGAGPVQILLRVIIPQSWPAILSVAIFHFVFAWNDYFGPLIYLGGRRDLTTISVGVQVFNFQYGPRPELVQATSLMAMVLPVVIFIVAQRVFMRGVVITGVEK
ncbi:MAG: carbohydrate ABC transporter permease [Anaerolineae bacterium]|nr:carbohydrate ABC transporter permease [Anaerolineae bacterium]